MIRKTDAAIANCYWSETAAGAQIKAPIYETVAAIDALHHWLR
jgi:hypothetical protein